MAGPQERDERWGRGVMFAGDLLAHRRKLNDAGIVFLYHGYVSEKLLAGIGAALRLRLESEGIKPVVARTLFAIYVEQLQNVIRYSADELKGEPPDDATCYGEVVIGVEGTKHFVICGNMMADGLVPRLEERLSRLKNLSKDELKDLYKAQMKLGPEEDSKGAGLGLIDIARKASEPIEYAFVPARNGQTYFSIKAVV